MQIKVKAEELEMKIEDETYIVTVRDWGDAIRGYFTIGKTFYMADLCFVLDRMMPEVMIFEADDDGNALTGEELYAAWPKTIDLRSLLECIEEFIYSVKEAWGTGNEG